MRRRKVNEGDTIFVPVYENRRLSIYVTKALSVDGAFISFRNARGLLIKLSIGLLGLSRKEARNTDFYKRIASMLQGT